MRVKSDHRSKFSNLSNWKEEAWKKKSGLQRDSNPWPLRYWCDALPTELWIYCDDHFSLSSITAVQMWPLTRKRSLRLAVLKRIAVQSPFTSHSNGLRYRSNGWSYPFKKYCHPFELLELSVQKILPSVRTAGAIRSKNIAIRSNGSSYPFKKYCHPFERLELSVQKILSSVRTAQAIRSKMVIRLNGSPPVHKIEESLCSRY